jgi:hypothetical protein
LPPRPILLNPRPKTARIDLSALPDKLNLRMNFVLIIVPTKPQLLLHNARTERILKKIATATESAA